MLENLRRKSLVKTYIDPIHRVHFEQGLARYRNHVEIDVCTQKLSKELQESLFQKAIDTISKDTFFYLTLPMIFCPSGKFTMGDKDNFFKPPKEETIERPFLLGETEITQELYTKVIGYNPSWFRNRPQNPVEQVSWVDAILFCNELSRLQGLELCYTENKRSLDYGWDCDFSKNGYRLPREKEWEYAAKAGTENRCAGTDKEEDLDKYAWFDDNSEINGEKQTHPVKSKLPNEWGFYDMSGNVWEWCWDKYNPKAKGKFLDDRVVRGGSWKCNAPYLHSGRSNSNCPSYGLSNSGFRVCRSI